MQPPKVEQHVGIVGSHLDDALICLNRFWIIVQNLVVPRGDQVLLHVRKLVAQFDSFSRILLGFVVLAQIFVGPRELGISQRKFGILFGGRFEQLRRFEIFPLALKLEPVAVVPQGRQRRGRRLEGLRLKFFNRPVGQIEFLADVRGQTIHGGKNFLIARGFSLELTGVPALQILDGRINSNLISEFRVLPPDDRVGIAEFSDALNCRRIERSVRRNPQIPKNLSDAFGRNGAELRRLPDVGAQHLGYARAKPIQRRISGCIAQGKNRERHGRRCVSCRLRSI